MEKTFVRSIFKAYLARSTLVNVLLLQSKMTTVLVRPRGRQKNGWKERKLGTNVETSQKDIDFDEPAPLLNQVYPGCTQRKAEPSGWNERLFAFPITSPLRFELIRKFLDPHEITNITELINSKCSCTQSSMCFVKKVGFESRICRMFSASRRLINFECCHVLLGGKHLNRH